MLAITSPVDGPMSYPHTLKESLSLVLLQVHTVLSVIALVSLTFLYNALSFLFVSCCFGCFSSAKRGGIAETKPDLTCQVYKKYRKKIIIYFK